MEKICTSFAASNSALNHLRVDKPAQRAGMAEWMGCDADATTTAMQQTDDDQMAHSTTRL